MIAFGLLNYLINGGNKFKAIGGDEGSINRVGRNLHTLLTYKKNKIIAYIRKSNVKT